MKVWVRYRLRSWPATGEYVVGIYSTEEKADAAFPDDDSAYTEEEDVQ